MSTIEDRLQAAADAAADTVAADSVPPLDLSGIPSRPNHTPPRRRRRFAVLAPAAAAVAVVGVIIAATTLSGATHPPSRTTSQSAGLRSVPPYYLTAGELVVSGYLAKEGVLHATFTGRPVATFQLPRPYDYISGFAGAGNGRTFVVAGRTTESARSYATAFFLARFDPGSRKVTVTPLHVPKVTYNISRGGQGLFLTAMALSPTATRLAVATLGFDKAAGSGGVSIYSLPSGRAKMWTATQGEIGPQLATIDRLDPRAMSWSRSGMLAVNDNNSVRLLNPATSGGGSLLEHSRLVARMPDPSEAMLTPDGRRIVAAENKEHYRGYPPRVTSVDSAVYEFSTATGKVISVRDKHHSRTSYLSVYWTNPSGSVLVVGTTGSGLGVLTGKRFTPLRGAVQPQLVPYWIAF